MGSYTENLTKKSVVFSKNNALLFFIISISYNSDTKTGFILTKYIGYCRMSKVYLCYDVIL